MQSYVRTARPFAFIVVILTLALAGSVHAQGVISPNAVAPNAVAQNAVAGAWLMRYERPVNDARSGGLHSATTDAVEVVQGRLTLRQSGDSVFGEWQPIVAKGDTAPPPRNVHGVQRRDSLLLRFIPLVDNDAGMIATAAHEVVEFIKTYVHGMPPTTTALEVALRGDVLTGTRRTVLLDGTPRGQPQALTGARSKP